MATKPPASSKSSKPGSDVIEAEWTPVESPDPASSPASPAPPAPLTLHPRIVRSAASGPAARGSGKLRPASATASAPERCPLCGKEASLLTVKLAIVEVRACPRCLAIGNGIAAFGRMLLR